MIQIVGSYLPVAVLALLGVVTVFGALYLANRLMPRKPNPEKLSTYECGETPIGDTRIPVDIKYYIYVLVFLVMDIEIVFLLPWAVELRNLGEAGFIEMILFILLLVIGWGYAWKKGVLRWLK